MNTNEKLSRRTKVYLEALRILALFLVMINHSPVFLLFANLTGGSYAVSVGLSVLCKTAVPLFFMISGAVLLGKKESFRQLFCKRILKCVAAIYLFSFLYVMKSVIRDGAYFSLWGFIKSVPFEVTFLPYWYLYCYLAFLVILPLLRPLAQNLSKNIVVYLAALQVVFGCFFPYLGQVKDIWICPYFDISPVLEMIVFYPLMGYGLSQFFKGDDFKNWKGIVLNLGMLPMICLSWYAVYQRYQSSGVYTEQGIGSWTAALALILFIDGKIIFEREVMPERLKKCLVFAGDKTFGMYLLDGFIGTGGKMDVIFQVLSPFVGYLPAYLVELVVVFFIRLVGATVLKYIPVFRKIL